MKKLRSPQCIKKVEWINECLPLKKKWLEVKELLLLRNRIKDEYFPNKHQGQFIRKFKLRRNDYESEIYK